MALIVNPTKAKSSVASWKIFFRFPALEELIAVRGIAAATFQKSEMILITKDYI